MSNDGLKYFFANPDSHKMFTMYKRTYTSIQIAMAICVFLFRQNISVRRNLQRAGYKNILVWPWYVLVNNN